LLEIVGGNTFAMLQSIEICRAPVTSVKVSGATRILSGVLGALVDLSWRARLQHIDRGWV
jgi:hypothetical protein